MGCGVGGGRYARMGTRRQMHLVMDDEVDAGLGKMRQTHQARDWETDVPGWA